MARRNEEGEGRLVSALARGLSIVACFSPSKKELSARELMELTGLPKPTLFRLLETLCEFGLLRYSERSSQYVAGVGLLDGAAAALSRMSIRQLARPMMLDLADHIRGQIELVVGYKARLNFVEIAQGHDSKVYLPEIGSRVSMTRAASGRAYLLSTRASIRDEYLQDLGARDPERKAWLVGRLDEAQKELVDHGFCLGHGDLHREMAVVAVPVVNQESDETWVFAATVPVFSPQSKQLLDDVGPRLVSLVRNVEAALGNSR